MTIFILLIFVMMYGLIETFELYKEDSSLQYRCYCDQEMVGKERIMVLNIVIYSQIHESLVQNLSKDT